MDNRTINAISLMKVLGASLVVAAHYFPLFYGKHFYSFGTGCFFMVAGYYALTWEKSRGLVYFGKRMARLYPGYIVAVIFYLIATQSKWPEWPYLLAHHLAFLLTASSAETVFSLNPAFWSLPVFITFFAIVAVLPTTEPKFTGVAFLAVLPFATLYLGGLEWRDGYLQLLAFPLYFYAFWLGGAIGKKQREKQLLPHHKHTFVAAAAVMIILLMGSVYRALNPDSVRLNAFIYEEFMTVVYALLFYSILRAPLTNKKLPIIEKAGAISFGVYLFHNWPTRFFEPLLPNHIAILLSMVSTILLAWASLVFVERPIQKYLKPKITKKAKQDVTGNRAGPSGQ